MRVFYSGWKGYCGQAVIRAIEKLGHDIMPWYYKAERKSLGVKESYKKFVKDLNDYDPDVVFILKAGPSEGNMDEIKKEDRTTMFFTLDDPAVRINPIALKSDYIFTSCEDSKEKYEKSGGKAKTLYIGFDQDFYFGSRDSDTVYIYNKKKKKWIEEICGEEKFKTDILMTGQDYEDRYRNLRYTPTRVNVAKRLIREHFDVSIWGWGNWSNYPELQNAYKGLVHNRVLGKLHDRAKIIICEFGSRANMCLNLRFFEIMGMGKLNMCYRQKGIPEMFPENKEVVYWNTLDELVDKCRYYLSHQKERELIAKAGQKHILTEYTTYHQVKKMFEFAGLGKEKK